MSRETAVRTEQVDVVIVGSRCAGSAAAVALARRGRRVIALDSAGFPSDTLSTHLFWPSTWAEVERVGALSRVRALGAPEHTEGAACAAGVRLQGRYRPVEGFHYGASVRRPGLDLALVQTAREAGAEVRERTRVTDLVRDRTGRVNGVVWKDRDGTSGTIGAKLVVGADGRRSTVARLVGATDHHRFENRRLMAFAYYRDPRDDERHVAVQWRVGDELATVFPCDGGLALVLLMSPVGREAEFRDDPVATFERTVARIEPLAERLEGCERESRVRTSYRHPSYFRHSHGPGWALAGDAGHFKDPVTAQGIRDALRFGRLLGEAVAPVLDDGPVAIDRATRSWERDRDRQCLPMYQWANGLGAADDVSPIEAAAYAWLARRPEGASDLLDVFARAQPPQSIFNARNLAIWVRDALRDPVADHRLVGRTVHRDVRRELGRQRERLAFAARRAASERARQRRARAEARPGGPTHTDGAQAGDSRSGGSNDTLRDEASPDPADGHRSTDDPEPDVRRPAGHAEPNAGHRPRPSTEPPSPADSADTATLPSRSVRRRGTSASASADAVDGAGWP